MPFDYRQHVKTVWYDDIPFKSLIEAKWYALYSKLGLDPYYEPESFDIPMQAQYTPDFFIAEWDLFHEVKLCKMPSHDEFKRCFQLSESIKRRVLITWGEPGSTTPSSILYTPGELPSGKSMLACCPVCGCAGWVDDGSCRELVCEHKLVANGNKSIKFRNAIRDVNEYKFIKS